MAESFRWKSTATLDVDAYFLADKRWMLFAYVKDEKGAGDPKLFENLARGFKQGEVAVVAGAVKTDKQSRPLPPLTVDRSPLTEAWAIEGWIRFRLEAAEVLNPGLFLDQRHNRERLIARIQSAAAKGAFTEADSLLNLFSYTGSFSLAALCAGCKSTTSVDVSSRYLKWETANFDANFGGLEVSRKLICDDARDYLRRAAKKGSKYRWIILDPPTFSRGQKKLFKVRDELLPMVEDAVTCLAKDRESAVLVSMNDATWDTRKFYADLEKIAKTHKLKFEKGVTPKDFGPEHPLKSAWLVNG